MKLLFNAKIHNCYLGLGLNFNAKARPGQTPCHCFIVNYNRMMFIKFHEASSYGIIL